MTYTRASKLATVLGTCALVLAGTTQASAVGSSVPGSSTFGDGRPWWDPTQVIEVPVDPSHAEGDIVGLTFTDSADGDHVLPVKKANDGTPPNKARVAFTGVGYTPNLFYTVRVTIREAGSGKDWGVYTWQTYKATEDGKLHVDLSMLIPARAKAGEKIVAVPTVYSATDVRRDGRPNKQDPQCVLNCKRVAPLTAWTDYNASDATITIAAQ